METRKHPNSTFFYPSSAITQIPRFACFSNPSVWERHQSWEKVGSASSTTSHMDGWLVSHVNAAPYKGLWIVNAPPYMESADLRSCWWQFLLWLSLTTNTCIGQTMIVFMLCVNPYLAMSNRYTGKIGQPRIELKWSSNCNCKCCSNKL